VRLLSLLTHNIAPFSPLSATLSLPDGSLSLTFLPDGSLTLRFWLNNCAVFVAFTCPFGSKTLTSYSRLRHSSCAILHLTPCRTLAPLFLSVKLPLPRSYDARAQRHVPRGSAHLL